MRSINLIIYVPYIPFPFQYQEQTTWLSVLDARRISIAVVAIVLYKVLRKWLQIYNEGRRRSQRIFWKTINPPSKLIFGVKDRKALN